LVYLFLICDERWSRNVLWDNGVRAWSSRLDRLDHARDHYAMFKCNAFRITPVRAQDDLNGVVKLFRAYAASLDVDLAYQDFEAELQSMPGKYAPPAGALLLAHDAAGSPVGCVGLRPMETPGCCEMKRLYVAPEGRGHGLGEELAKAVMHIATQAGYREIRLDTLPSMPGAVALYRKLGFEPMAPYYDTPVAGTIFLRRTLVPAAQNS
jgi:ribosomal protein S18 acetylase RimI-like enzyme